MEDGLLYGGWGLIDLYRGGGHSHGCSTGVWGGANVGTDSLTMWFLVGYWILIFR